MIQQKSFRDTLPFPAASILAFMYLTFYFISFFAQEFLYNVPFGFISVFQWAFLVLIFSLAVLFLVKIPNVGITISLGLISLIQIYWCIPDLSSYADEWFDGYFYFWELYGIISIFKVIIFLMLTIQSISTYSNAKMSFLNAVWFLPGLLQFTIFTITLIGILSGGNVMNIMVTSVTSLFYALFIMFAGRWLADVARAKHPELRHSDSIAYNASTPRVPFVQPPVPNYVPQPPMPPVPPMPRVPVAPVVPPVPQAPFVPQPQPQAVVNDPARELGKYKEMLDNGLITEEEYNAKKKQILNL